MSRMFPFGRATVVAPVVRSTVYRPPVQTVDELLASCPTGSDIRTFWSDFDLRFDPLIFDDPRQREQACVPGGTGSNVALAVYNMFRCLRHITFDSPVPLFGSRNVYSWLRSVHPVIYVFHGVRGEMSYSLRPSSPGIHITHMAFAWPDERYWVLPAGGGLFGAVCLVLHEAWHHASGKAHDTPGNLSDSSLEYGGAHAAVYWYCMWLAEHSGSYLTAEERRIALCYADAALRNCSVSVPSRPGC